MRIGDHSGFQFRLLLEKRADLVRRGGPKRQTGIPNRDEEHDMAASGREVTQELSGSRRTGRIVRQLGDLGGYDIENRGGAGFEEVPVYSDCVPLSSRTRRYCPRVAFDFVTSQTLWVSSFG